MEDSSVRPPSASLPAPAPASRPASQRSRAPSAGAAPPPAPAPAPAPPPAAHAGAQRAPPLSKSASIQVACRFKPTAASLAPGGAAAPQPSARGGAQITHSVKDGTVDVRLRARAPPGGVVVNNNVSDFSFSLSALLPPATTQQEVFDACVRDIADGALDGVSGCVLAYGQTGAGKTYTMTGPSTGSYAERGCVPRSISYVFERAEAARQAAGGEDRYQSIRVSYVEIYNDKLIDLLAKTPGDLAAAAAAAAAEDPAAASVTTPLSAVAAAAAAQSGFLHVQEDRRGRVFVPGLTCPLVRSEAEAIGWLFAGEANRAVAEHALNKASTRSHCIFTVYLEQLMPADEAMGVGGAAAAGGALSRSLEARRLQQAAAAATAAAATGGADGEPSAPPAAAPPPPPRMVCVRSKLHLVDLAGSERLEKTASEGAIRREAQAINKSLAFLEQVVVALLEKGRDHVPYRQSKLTHMLKDALGGHCRTRMIAACWSDPDHVDETLSTLRFATRMMRVKTTPARDVALGEQLLTEAERERIVALYEAEIAALRTELALHDAMGAVLGGGAPSGGGGGGAQSPRANSALAPASAPLDSRYLGVRYGPVSVMEAEAIRGLVDRFVSGEADDVDVASVRQLKLAMHYLRDIARRAPGAGAGGRAGASPRPGTLASTTKLPAASPLLPAPAAAAAGAEDASDAGLMYLPGRAPLPQPDFDGTQGGESAGAPFFPPADGAELAESGGRFAGFAGGPAAPSERAAARRRFLDEAARSAALEAWRSDGGAGAAVSTDFALARGSLKAKRAEHAAAAAAVNEAKRRIDALAAQAAAQREAGAGADAADVDAAAAAARALGADLAAAKSAYRRQFDALGGARAEADYLQRVVDSLAAQLAREFARHWARACGLPDSATPASVAAEAAEDAQLAEQLAQPPTLVLGAENGAAGAAAPPPRQGAAVQQADGEEAYRRGMLKTQLTVAQAEAKRKAHRDAVQGSPRR